MGGVCGPAASRLFRRALDAGVGRWTVDRLPHRRWYRSIVGGTRSSRGGGGRGAGRPGDARRWPRAADERGRAGTWRPRSRCPRERRFVRRRNACQRGRRPGQRRPHRTVLRPATCRRRTLRAGGPAARAGGSWGKRRPAGPARFRRPSGPRRQGGRDDGPAIPADGQGGRPARISCRSGRSRLTGGG